MFNRKIILASGSPSRKRLLTQILGNNFKVDVSDIEEKLNPRLKPRGNAEELSLQKAQAVAAKYKDAIIIAADTFMVIGDDILGKPKDKKDAKRMLLKLSGQMHKTVTGFTLIDTSSGKTITKSVETNVYFKKMSMREIDGYINTGEPMGKAGAYAMQGKGAMFIEKIDGSPSNVLGLPINALSEVLNKFGVNII